MSKCQSFVWMKELSFKSEHPVLLCVSSRVIIQQQSMWSSRGNDKTLTLSKRFTNSTYRDTLVFKFRFPSTFSCYHNFTSTSLYFRTIPVSFSMFSSIPPVHYIRAHFIQEVYLKQLLNPGSTLILSVCLFPFNIKRSQGQSWALLPSVPPGNATLPQGLS